MSNGNYPPGCDGPPDPRWCPECARKQWPREAFENADQGDDAVFGPLCYEHEKDAIADLGDRAYDQMRDDQMEER